MRWLVVLLVLVPRFAAAERFVVEEPSMYYKCPSGKTWEAIEDCLRKQGRPTVVKRLEHARLVRLDQQENGKWVDGGVYFYAMQPAIGWKIAGAFLGRGTDYEVLAFEPITAGVAKGYRADIGQAHRLWVQLDGVTSIEGVLRSYQSLYCSPLESSCRTVVKSCEVLVRGRAYWTFRGRVAVDGNQVTISGDRRLAGPFCTQTERVYLGLKQRP